MIPEKLEEIKAGRELTDAELNALYVYLDMHMDSMSEEEISFWAEILSKVDKEFYDDTSDGTDGL